MNIPDKHNCEVYDHTRCQLGEGPVWHPHLQGLFWCDILAGKLHFRSHEIRQNWTFGEAISAIGLVDSDNLIVAGETGLWIFNIKTGSRYELSSLEAEIPENRSNDGRADPWGGFWVSTMHKNAHKKHGSIYRWYKGELLTLVSDLTIPNGICFDADRSLAYYDDLASGIVWRQEVDKSTGWPVGPSQVFIDVSREGLNIDGAIIDADGNYVAALWAGGGINVYSRQGNFLHSFNIDASNTTCPAFGGDNFSDLFVTSAIDTLGDCQTISQNSGKTFVLKNVIRGRAESYVDVRV